MSAPAAQSTDAHLQADGVTRVKVCGIVERPEIDLLAARGVDFVGLWWGVPGGPHDLELRTVARARARRPRRPRA